MRIAIISPLDMRVPPIGYGGTELVVSHLTEELVRRGHEVTLFASGDSITSARLIPGSPCFLRGSDYDKELLTLRNIARCLEQAHEFDIIHNHTMQGMALAGLVTTPMLTTLHGNPSREQLDLFRAYRGWYNAISHSAHSLLPERDGSAGVVYNAIDCSTYPFNPGPREDFLLYFSRISEEKGPHIAIDIARRAGRKLVIAGNINPGTPDEAFFRDCILPQIDGEQIIYVGEADAEQKRTLLEQTSCLLAPIIWPEPFGLFMIEAQACGTPVIALRNGAAPEVVCHERTGFVVDTPEEMLEALDRIDSLSPYECRSFVEGKFSVGNLADGYLEAYARVLGASSKVVDLTPAELLYDGVPVLRDGI